MRENVGHETIRIRDRPFEALCSIRERRPEQFADSVIFCEALRSRQ
jgi:hypothetical protein